MEIILHFGAHRCATTSFQEYMRRNAPALAKQGVAFWGPETTRETDLRSLKSLTDDSHATLHRELDRLQQQGFQRLLVSEENFLGTMRQNLNKGELYPEADLRARLVADVFDGRISKVALNVRALNTYWSSVVSYAVRNKKDFAENVRWAKIAKHHRSWRDVITDLAAAFPNTQLSVLPFEEFAGHPDAQLAKLLGSDVPHQAADLWLGKDIDEEPQVSNSAQEVRLMTKFADDLTWLASGADGLAQLCLLQETMRGETKHA
ncbi:hypothetical protein [Ruegeria halocynthiae]|uniref:hypothetical protein n=1 Tax=Ruegeria halocynthiae TaxID=985054 RepID=UPI00056C1608|nr:hypothetical protein [Ruegeria halocynthiae]